LACRSLKSKGKKSEKKKEKRKRCYELIGAIG